MRKKYLFDLNHPAHFHFFKNIINQLKIDADVLITAKNKDLLLDLLKESKLNYVIIEENERKNGLVFSGLNLVKRDIKIFNVAKNFNPDIIIGISISATHVSKLLGKNSLYFGEDGAKIVPLSYKIGYPFASNIITPAPTDVGKYSNKQIKYDGYQKLAYLHPYYFTPNKDILKKYGLDQNDPFFLLRFSALKAHHDIKIGGITENLKFEIIKILSKEGKVFISSEKPLSEKLDKYRLKISPDQIHHFLFYAKLFISDSQSMSVEAAMLGTPSIRFSDFAGRISVLEELEHKYQLTFGINTKYPENLIYKIEELLSVSDLKKVFQLRRNKMLKEKIDVTSFLVWFIENYPDSEHIMKKNPEYQKKFKTYEG